MTDTSSNGDRTKREKKKTWTTEDEDEKRGRSKKRTEENGRMGDGQAAITKSARNSVAEN